MMPPAEKGSGSQQVFHDEKGHRFYLPLKGGYEGFLLYRREGNSLDFYHTYVPEPFREKGLAEKIVEKGFLYAKEKNLKVIPSCSYVSHWFLRKRKEFLPLVTPSPDFGPSGRSAKPIPPSAGKAGGGVISKSQG